MRLKISIEPIPAEYYEDILYVFGILFTTIKLPLTVILYHLYVSRTTATYQSEMLKRDIRG